ncbi:hypothetical protein ACWD6R_05415 [Streptomyces sp. NPDC005151]
MTIASGLDRSTARRISGREFKATAEPHPGYSPTKAVPASSQEGTEFDLDHGNALTEVVYPKFQRVSPEVSFGRSVTLTVDHAMQIEMPWFDALVP